MQQTLLTALALLVAAGGIPRSVHAQSCSLDLEEPPSSLAGIELALELGVIDHCADGLPGTSVCSEGNRACAADARGMGRAPRTASSGGASWAPRVLSSTHPMGDAAGERMGAAEFLEWCGSQVSGRYELVAGEVVAMAPERVAHVRLKASVWRALDDALRAAGSECEALTDGATVQIDEETVYEPDALVHCHRGLSPDAVVVPDPVVVVEVLSPSTAGRDAAAKLEDYLRLPSVIHYLILKTERPALIHHHRREDGSIATHIHHGGSISLNPPGITIDLDEIFRP